jgi:hypothetical protein
VRGRVGLVGGACFVTVIVLVTVTVWPGTVIVWLEPMFEGFEWAAGLLAGGFDGVAVVFAGTAGVAGAVVVWTSAPTPAAVELERCLAS